MTEVLRTPEERFADVPGSPHKYVALRVYCPSLLWRGRME